MNTLLLRILEPFFPIYQRLAARVSRRSLVDAERLAECYEGFLKKKHRLILAFQHPSTAEPAIWPVILATEVRKILRKRGQHAFPFAHLVYDSRIPLWAGAYLKWLLPQIGGVAIQRGKPDTRALRTLRRLLLESPYPLMIAPEGGKTYRSSRWAELEDGTGMLALWCREDLKKLGREEDVLILPLRVCFEYRESDRCSWEKVVAAWEKLLGLAPKVSHGARLNALITKTLEIAGLISDSSASWQIIRRNAAGKILASLGGDLQKDFISEVRSVEAVLLDHTKKLTGRQRQQGNALSAAEILHYLDFSWPKEEESWNDLAEALEAALQLSRLLLPKNKLPGFAPARRHAVFKPGWPIELSRLPEGLPKAEELNWIRSLLRRDGLPPS